MKKILNSIRHITPYVGALLLAKFISVLLMLFLPDIYNEKNISTNATMEFRNYKVDEAFGFRARQQEETMQVKDSSHHLKDFLLKAIYRSADGGYVFVVNKASQEAVVLAKEETYQNYTLTHIFATYVIFTKNGVNYNLKLFGDNPNDTVEMKSSTSKNSLSVPKSDVLKYATDIDAIWKNITIQEVIKDGQITGFEIRDVKEKSAFGQLGLKAKDIITKVNGEPLNSYAQAFKIYNDIASFNYLEITVMRNGKEKDLGYEIK